MAATLEDLEKRVAAIELELAMWRLANVETPAERGAKLLQISRQQQAQWAAGMANVLEELGISGEPIGAEKVREMFEACGVKPEDNEFSRGIIEMREE